MKLKHLEKWLTRRNAIAQQYVSAFRNISDIILPIIGSDVRHAFHLFVIRTSQRDSLQKHLNRYGIETGIHYPIALPRLEAYRYLGQSLEPMRANAFDQIF